MLIRAPYKGSRFGLATHPQQTIRFASNGPTQGRIPAEDRQAGPLLRRRGPRREPCTRWHRNPKRPATVRHPGTGRGHCIADDLVVNIRAGSPGNAPASPWPAPAPCPPSRCMVPETERDGGIVGCLLPNPSHSDSVGVSRLDPKRPLTYGTAQRPNPGQIFGRAFRPSPGLRPSGPGTGVAFEWSPSFDHGVSPSPGRPLRCSR